MRTQNRSEVITTQPADREAAVDTATVPRSVRRRGTPRRISEPRSDRLLNVVSVVVLSAIAVSIVYPFVFIASASLSDPGAVNSGEVVLWPIGVNLDAYQAILNYPEIVRGFLNSLLYSGAVMVLGTAIVIAGGYALSRSDLPGRNFFMVVFVITMLFSGGMIPLYLVAQSLGILNTAWAMILPSCMSVWQLIVTRTYFQVTVPKELLECSQLDGATDFSFFFRVVVPLAKPLIAVNCLLFAVASWNAYFNALIYLTDPNLYPLPLVMRNLLIENTYDPSKLTNIDPSQLAQAQQLAAKLKYALIIIACIPPLVAYPFVQKHFVKGMMLGSLKG
ncbi:carbohydrate ABC transporter permease [Kribbella catacumbae]|uniref:carbohydrate ABC transporter permease n=1 Tax=Kribbella catacumbae TaxID=460086 RepID=UPI00036EB85B|nr:carbohydrate ABC transporter permease [Kribbella catacumbae]